MSRLSKENFLITGLICIIFGAFFTVAEIYSMAGTIGAFGIIMFIIGMSLQKEQRMSKDEIDQWLPVREQLPQAGRVMYRIDTTIDEPIKTTVMCGQCTHIELVDGIKPSLFVCPQCKTLLWEEE